ncbi:MAG: hypothetical protein WAO91_00370 [Candidatus Nitrosotenuis sp.]
MPKENDMDWKVTPKPVVDSDITGKTHRLTASVNPLVFIEADSRFHFGSERQLTPEAVLRYLASETFIPEMDNIKKAYEYIAKPVTRLFVVPAEYKILEKIIRPLKNALGSYIIGNPFETIALCGTVSEMIAIFLFEINEVYVDGKSLPSDEEFSKNLEEFENFGQKERVKRLYKFGLIDNDIKEKFDFIRKKRNQYLHRLSKTLENAAPDAKEVFDATFEIFMKISGLSVNQGKVILNQKIIDYLRKKNLIEDISEY